MIDRTLFQSPAAACVGSDIFSYFMGVSPFVSGLASGECERLDVWIVIASDLGGIQQRWSDTDDPLCRKPELSCFYPEPVHT
ncbi:protein of unknown function [Candidatus Filomicrobium marinum]|uniref:Uncharacterized protein n=1 Tax=Candidatus Filomicrobium marinum TaxID=1608628 RepID=A0A0D6JKE3_9HYPH|nr:protein of unknown function [Candidatus Filomicrobium marinum]CPR22130.1 protein of unknown function [Candidatus Filomicrobium marinum]